MRFSRSLQRFPLDNLPQEVLIAKASQYQGLSVLYNMNTHYSSLSNKRAGWNKMCRLENWAKFGVFENLNLCWVDLNHF